MGEAVIQRLLASFAAVHQATRFAIWSVRGAELALEDCVRLDQAVVDDVAAVWGAYRPEIEGGHAQRIAKGHVLPLITAGHCVGLVFLDHVQQADPVADQFQDRFIREVAAALADAPAKPILSPSLLERPDVVERVKRAQVVFLLEKHEWTVARVARMLRVSRSALYEFMGRVAIERPRPSPKAPRRRRRRGPA